MRNSGRLIGFAAASALALVPLAVVIGLGTGLGAVGFRYLIEAITWAFTGTYDFSDAGRVGSPHFPGLGIWFLLIGTILAYGSYRTIWRNVKH